VTSGTTSGIGIRISDVLVQVGELIFPIDFYVLNMEEGFSNGSVPIILGRLFMKQPQPR